jgi:AbrB family looped-hinge helix DNA binding protein
VEIKDNQVFGTVKVGERGQIVIPKNARELLEICPGDNLFIVAGKKRGAIIFKAEKIKEFAKELLEKIDKLDNLNPELKK